MSKAGDFKMKPYKFQNKMLVWILIAAMVNGSCNFINTIQNTTPAVETLEVTKAIETSEPIEEVPATPTEVALPFTLSSSPRFAVFEESTSAVTPMLAHEAIAPDLSNVAIPFILSAVQLERLAKNGFVVSPGDEREFFTLYEKARYDNVPIFVTSDALLHVYHLMFSKTLRVAEVKHFIPLLSGLNQAMLIEADKVYQALKDNPDWGDAALRIVAFLGVGGKLLDLNSTVPAYAADLVNQEVALIEQASGMYPSPIFPGLENGEDYTQYIPRGHYTRSDALKSYFKSMMWYGRMTFRVKGLDVQVGKAETRSAILLVYALRQAQVNGRPALEAWADLYAPTAFFVGRSDDLTVIQYGDVFDHVFGQSASPQELANESKLEQFIDLAAKLPAPKILGIVISDTDDIEAATKGLRFMGQRFVPDAYIFRQLIYRNVGDRENPRGLPKGMDVMAAMGSQRAYVLLEQMGETNYVNYPEQMNKMRAWLSGLGVSDWTETLYNSWLYCFYPLLAVPGAGYPAFMQSEAWLDKQLNTALGSWTELKHDTVLYAKQVYAELGGGPPPPPPLPPKGYVEPEPLFFARLSALTSMTRKGLESRGLLSPDDQEGLLRLEDLANVLQIMAGKQLRGEPLSEQEYERIRYIGGELEHLTMLAAESESVEPGAQVYMEEEQQAALVTDVATNPGSTPPSVLQEAIGRINHIYVVAPIIEANGNITLQVSMGGVFSYYEFEWPAQDRLTNEKWRKMLEDGQAPPLPSWTASFLVQETENERLRQGVSNFQKSITYVYWEPMYALEWLVPAQEPWRAEIEMLNAQSQYISHQLMNVHFRSFDFQSPTVAVVSVRESWQDKLYTYTQGYPTYSDDALTGERGPYTLDAVYTLEFRDGYWEVVSVVYNSAPPNW
jgi:hypothetical protein